MGDDLRIYDDGPFVCVPYMNQYDEEEPERKVIMFNVERLMLIKRASESSLFVASRNTYNTVDVCASVVTPLLAHLRTNRYWMQGSHVESMFNPRFAITIDDGHGILDASAFVDKELLSKYY